MGKSRFGEVWSLFNGRRVISANPVSGPCSWFLVRRLFSPAIGKHWATTQ